MQSRLKQAGFTIVELLIVIVVIGILAAITIVAYNGIQARALDSTRSNDLAAIQKALELYKTEKGTYPAATANPGSSGWELSTDVAGTFIEELKPYIGEVPIDPVNTAASAYWYYYYSPTHSVAVTAGCNPARGGFYVLRAIYQDEGSKPASNPVENNADGCSGTIPGSWAGTGAAYTTHRFVN